jgi:hypothetical protein
MFQYYLIYYIPFFNPNNTGMFNPHKIACTPINLHYILGQGSTLTLKYLVKT